MYGGIDQLIDTYKGNPQPLAQKVQKAQQSQPPGEVPPDLEEALALQEIAELRQGAQNQQAMQAGGAQQSVVDKLKQMLGGMQQQAQMAQAPQQPSQGQPVMAARGGSIDQLMSNLGRYYAGGGIVAFNGEDESKVEDGEVKKKLQQYTLQQQGADYVARKQAAREAQAREEAEAEARRQALISQIPTGGQGAPASTGRMPGELERNVSNTLGAMPGASVSKAFSGSGIRGLMGLLGIAGDREDKPAPAAATPPATLDAESEKLKRLAAARAQTGQSTNVDLVPRKPIVGASPDDAKPRPSAGGPSVGGPAKPAEEAMSPMETALRKSIMDALAQDPEAIRKKAMEQNAQFMGLDALLKPAQDRITAREAMIKQMQGERTPAWAEALIAAGKPVRGGLGTLLGQMGNAAQATREGYQAQDLKFFDELSKLNAEIDKAKIEGRYKDVAAGQAAVKELISEKRQAEQSGTSLLNKQAQIEATKQIARDNAAARAQSAAAQLEEKRLRRQQQQQQFLAQEERKWQDTLSKNPDYKKLIDQRAMQERLLYMSTDPKTQEKAQAAVDALNDRIAKMLPTTGGGAANIPPPPKGAVTRVG